MHDYQLALTGDVFRWMLDYGEIETMERVSVFVVLWCSPKSSSR
jgi:cation-transporting ATPase 13A2